MRGCSASWWEEFQAGSALSAKRGRPMTSGAEVRALSGREIGADKISCLPCQRKVILTLLKTIAKEKRDWIPWKCWSRAIRGHWLGHGQVSRDCVTRSATESGQMPEVQTAVQKIFIMSSVSDNT